MKEPVMTHMSSLKQAIRTAFCVTALTIGVTLAPAVTRHVSAEAGRAAPVTTSQASYHVHLSYVAGPLAGRTIDAGVMGSLDSTGLFTATLMATTGATSTVMGSLGGSTKLAVAGKAIKVTLAGKPTSGSQYSGFIMGSNNQPLATWIMTPEPATSSFTFAGVIRSGKQRGTVVTGTLALAAARSGWFDGGLTLDNGSVVPADGQITYGNMTLRLYMPHGMLLVGVAPKGVSNTTGIPQTDYTGTFVGPGTGDHGTWSATQS